MRRVRSIVLALMLVVLLAACAPAAPAPTAVPTLTATLAPTLPPTLTLVPTATEIPTATPTPTATPEDFSDLHPKLTSEEALNSSDSILDREDLGRAVQKALAEAKPYPEGTEPAKFILVESQTGVKYIDYEENYYGLHPELVPSRIEGIYQFNDIRGINGVLAIVSYLTPDGIKVMTYTYDPTKGDPFFKLVDQCVIITPVYSESTSEKNAEVTKKYPDEDLLINQLKSKHYLEVKKALEDLVAFGKIPDDLWKTPLKPTSYSKTLWSEITPSN